MSSPRQQSVPAHVTGYATGHSAQLTGVSAPGAAALKIPVLQGPGSSLEVAQQRGHVLDADLLPGPDPGLGSQLQRPVPQHVKPKHQLMLECLSN